MMATADEVWARLVSLVMESRTDWRRSAVQATGLPFNQIRALRRIGEGPLTLTALADSMTVDAPAATVAVNLLEERGLVVRTPHPTNKRAKLVELTRAGRKTLDAALSVADKPPRALTALSATDLSTLARVVEQLNEPQKERHA
ncbi:MAG TPA: MarR family transcriptional regulator [Acidothermaceae bacterium]|nr:MarR family transcriptional regulator [Acidothermaceae bacterium]